MPGEVWVVYQEEFLHAKGGQTLKVQGRTGGGIWSSWLGDISQRWDSITLEGFSSPHGCVSQVLLCKLLSAVWHSPCELLRVWV